MSKNKRKVIAEIYVTCIGCGGDYYANIYAKKKSQYINDWDSVCEECMIEKQKRRQKRLEVLKS